MLINGDRLRVEQGPDGRTAVTEMSGHDGLFSLGADGVTEEIPGDALPYLGHGLARSLFNVALLRRAEAHGRLPVRVTFHGARPALPGVTVTSWGNGSAGGYLTIGSAGMFGAALSRQARLDQASGRYGTDGLFAGNTTVSLAGVRPAPARPAPARPATQSTAPKYTVTVTGTNGSGQPDSGDQVILVNAENVYTFYQGTFKDGSATFSVPASTYWVEAGYETDDQQTMHFDVLPEFKVTQDTTVHTDAQAATSAVTMTTPRPAKPYLADFDLDLKGQHGKYYFNSGWSSFAPDKVWVNPVSVKPTIGTLWCYANETLTGTETGVTPYGYNLDYADPPGTIPAQHYAAQASDLATTTNEYYEDADTTGAWSSLPTFRYQAASAPFVPLALPGKLVQYYSAGGAISWLSSFVEILGSSPYWALSGGQQGILASFRPGENQVVDWNRYPLHPEPAYSAGGLGGDLSWTQPSALRAGNNLVVSPYLFGDNVPGHTAGIVNRGTKSTVTYSIDQNGVKIASGAVGNGIPPVSLSAKPSVIKFTFDAAWNGPDYTLSKATQTVWTWHSAPDSTATLPHDWICAYHTTQRRCSVQSMLTLEYQVNGMRLNGSAPAGAQAIELSVGHIQLATAAAITGASVSASCDGGKTWQQATMTAQGNGQYKAGFTEPSGCDVTLRTSANDAAGNSMTETITDAYAVTG
jgi:hypothetical protein